MITVLGATGRVGRQVTALLEEPVRAVGRSADRLAALDAEPWPGDLADAAFLTAACTGADAVFAMTPTDPDAPDHAAAQAAKGEAIAAAVRAAGVPYVVLLSSLGAELPAGTGFITSLHDHEERLRATGTRLLVLRPAWFAENVADALPVVHAEGVLADSLVPDRPLPVVATRDIAAAAARALAAREETGVRELLGPADVAPAGWAAVLGRALGREVPYVRLPDGEMVDALVGAGFSPDAAARYVTMTGAMNAGLVAPLAGRTAANTTPTALADVLRELVA